jgi:protein transport protein SEC13
MTTLKSNGAQEHTQTFQAHEGPAWQVSWAHPKYESVIASCGYDNKVKIWRRDQTGNWENLVYSDTLSSSVNCIAWAPWEYGLILAAGTAEGRVYIFTRNAADGQWLKFNFIAHQEGVNGLSWSPSTEASMLSQA